MNTIQKTKENELEKFKLEVILLKTIFNSREAYLKVTELIKDDSIFDHPLHRIIFADSLLLFNEKGEPPDEVNVFQMQMVSKDNRAEVREHLSKVISISDTEFREIEILARRLIEMKAEAELKSFQGKLNDTGFDYIQAVSDKTSEISHKYISGCRRPLNNYEVAEKFITELMKGTSRNFIPTGIEKVDKYTNGIPKGHLTIIAGRPGTGKTTFMLQMLRYFLNHNIKAGIISLEMTAESLMIKNLSALTGIDSLKIESRDLTPQEKKQIAEAIRKLTEDNYRVIDMSLQTPASIKAQINHWKVRGEVDIVLLDYLTLINTNYKSLRFDLEIGRLSGELNQLAKSTGLPIVILSQLNRSSEARVDKKPQLSDLRESGSIEQDANLVLLLYRPGLYGIDATKDLKYKFMNLDGTPLTKHEYFEVIIAKARNGRTGNVTIRYRPEIHTFEPVRVEQLSGERLPGEYDKILSAEGGQFYG